jgi:hypothetical protein
VSFSRLFLATDVMKHYSGNVQDCGHSSIGDYTVCLK